ncbi:MAG: hypothetical protein DSM106950_01755 [Stigonema ocellatum SAG 48.90 = DSM 106950]|nr:hypothetical protein [Stigonema ocellatum SAG 48.90 = DSM 106950]
MNNILSKTVTNVISMVSDEQLQHALTESFQEAASSVLKCENFFELLPTHRWSDKMLARIFNSWKATHTKMLAIHGLSYRLQRLTLGVEAQVKEQLLLASAYNTQTNHEDLGVDYGAKTYAELYKDLADSFLGNYPWQLEEYCLAQAREFKQWIYHNMVVDDIPKGLLTNMFSEIYNYGEYTTALCAFSELIDNHYNFCIEEKEKALCYLNAHVAYETEVDHCQVVVKALNEYSKATNTKIDYQQAKLLFKEYLSRLSTLMEALTVEMIQETDAAASRLPWVS